MDSGEAQRVLPPEMFLGHSFICYAPWSEPTPTHTFYFLKDGPNDFVSNELFSSALGCCDRPFISNTVRWCTTCFLWWHVWCLGSTQPPALNEMSRSFMTRVKKLVSCSSVRGTAIVSLQRDAVLHSNGKSCRDNHLMNMVETKTPPRWGTGGIFNFQPFGVHMLPFCKNGLVVIIIII